MSIHLYLKYFPYFYCMSLLVLFKAAALAALRLAYPLVATLHKESPPEGGKLAPLLRGRCPLARFARSPPLRDVPAVHGMRASPSSLTSTTKRWSLRPASRVRLRPKCSPVRCSVAALPALRCGFRFRP